MIKKKFKPGSDIDILVISPKLKTSQEKGKIYMAIRRKIGFPSPFEIHLVTPEEYENWYKNFIREFVEI